MADDTKMEQSKNENEEQQKDEETGETVKETGKEEPSKVEEVTEMAPSKETTDEKKVVEPTADEKLKSPGAIEEKIPIHEKKDDEKKKADLTPNGGDNDSSSNNNNDGTAGDDPAAAADIEQPEAPVVMAANAKPLDEDALEAEYQERVKREMVSAQEITTAEAQKQAAAKPEPEKTFLEKYQWHIVGVFTVIIVIAIVLAATIPKGQDDPSEAPTAAPVDPLEYLTDLFSPTSGDALLQEGSPQNQALQFMAFNDSYILPLEDFGLDTPEILLERYAVITLYYATNGPAWPNQLRFLTPSSICEWPNIGQVEENASTFKEVDCDEEGQVIKVRLDQNELYGTIPHELVLLSNMNILDLADNMLYGTIPESLGELSRLTFFQIAVNQMTGTLPGNILRGWQDTIEIVSFYNNLFTGPVPDLTFKANDGFENLEIFDAARNQLTGSLPNGNPNSPIRMIFLEENQLTGSIPDVFYEWTTFEILSLSDNNLGGNLDNRMGGWENMILCWLQNNNLVGSIPETIGMAEDLLQLKLQGNQLTGQIPSEIGELDVLAELDLSGNLLSGPLPAEMGDMESLASFSVASNTQISGSLPVTFSKLTSLSRLILTDTNITDGLEQAFCEPDRLVTSIDADCRNYGEINATATVECSCCTTCCDAGGDNCEISVPSICLTQAGLRELDLERNATCECSEDGSRMTCNDAPNCTSCNLDETVCAANTDYGYSFNLTTGEITQFQNDIEYVEGGVWDNITLTFVDPADGRCDMFVNGEKCRTCGNTKCASGFDGFQIVCDNLPGGYDFNSCDENVFAGYFEILHVFSESELSGCPLLLERV